MWTTLVGAGGMVVINDRVDRVMTSVGVAPTWQWDAGQVLNGVLRLLRTGCGDGVVPPGRNNPAWRGPSVLGETFCFEDIVKRGWRCW